MLNKCFLFCFSVFLCTVFSAPARAVTDGRGNEVINRNVGIGITVPGARLAVDGSVYVLDGTVGIGTTTPRAMMEVTGSMTITGDVSIGPALNTYLTGNSDLFVQGAIETDATIYSLGSAGNYFNGNVGIGSAAPVAKLQVASGSAFVNEASLVVGGTINVNWATSNQQYVTLNDVGHTINNTNAQPGQTFRLIVCQDGSGNRTVTTWQLAGVAGDVLWAGGAPPTLSAGNDACDIISFIATAAKSGTKIMGAITKNF
ncbi:MAG: hypothetical protein HQL20_11205 [Candidatus Omnitrophica bacterium]|nr:hypothetical protein [Candidatus Omnitrophota bacterium]